MHITTTHNTHHNTHHNTCQNHTQHASWYNTHHNTHKTLRNTSHPYTVVCEWAFVEINIYSYVNTYSCFKNSLWIKSGLLNALVYTTICCLLVMLPIYLCGFFGQLWCALQSLSFYKYLPVFFFSDSFVWTTISHLLQRPTIVYFFDSFGLITKTYLCFFDSFGLHYNLSLVTKTTETGVGTQAAACSETRTQCKSSSIVCMILMYLYQPCSSLLMHTWIKNKTRLNTD